MGWIYLAFTLVLTIYGQIILKWRVDKLGSLPDTFHDIIDYYFNALSDIWVISSFVSALLASFFWIAVLTKLKISVAYPFTSLSFVFVLMLSYFLFNENITMQKILGVLLIIIGLLVANK